MCIYIYNRYIKRKRGSRVCCCCCCPVAQVVSDSVTQHARLLCPPLSPVSSTISQSLLNLMSIELVMPSNHLTLYHPLVLLLSVFPSIRVFSSELAVHIRWPKYWSFSFSLSPSNEYSGLISLRLTSLIPSLSKGLTGVFFSTTV